MKKEYTNLSKRCPDLMMVTHNGDLHSIEVASKTDDIDSLKRRNKIDGLTKDYGVLSYNNYTSNGLITDNSGYSHLLESGGKKNMLINFAVHGYIKPFKDWFYETLEHFNNLNLPLKSVFYDVNYSRFERKSIKKFLTEIENIDLDNLFSFSISQLKSLKEPERYEYKICYYTDQELVLISFNSDLFCKNKIITDTIPCLLKKYLSDSIAQFGYLHIGLRGYILADHNANLNLYKENSKAWDYITRPFNIHILRKMRTKLRHVYHTNLINADLLNYQNNSFNFREWLSSGEYGTLEKVGIENWFWQVPENKVYEAGKILYKQGLLLGVDRYKEILASEGVIADKLVFKLKEQQD